MPACFATAGRSVPSWKFRYLERSFANVTAGITPNPRNDGRTDLDKVHPKLVIVFRDCMALSCRRDAVEPGSKLCRPHLANAVNPPITGLKLECRSRSEEHTSELQSLRHLVCR